MFVQLIVLLSVVLAGLCAADGGFTWTLGTTASQSAAASSVSNSASGQYIAAADPVSDKILISSNYGKTWTTSSIGNTCSMNTNPYFTGISSDASGKYLAVSSSTGGISFSQNYGSSWFCRNAPSPQKWSSITSDVTGKYIYATITGGSTYRSADYGNSWNSTWSSLHWASIASDYTGANVVEVAQEGDIYTTTDYGVTWTQSVETNARKTWTKVVADSTGRYLSAVSTDNGLFLSNNYGQTWSLTLSNVLTVASDYTGLRLAVILTSNTISVTSNRGSSWADAGAPKGSWHTINSNGDGTRLIAQMYSNSPASNALYIGVTGHN